jgi:hypothetical protein
LDPRDTPTTFGGVGGKPWYVLTDAQGDLVSIAHVPTGSNQSAEVGGQWTYSPYGEVLTYEKLRPHPVVVFGHKTLAVDRLDVANPIQWDLELGYISELPRLTPGARLFGYARNRTLDIARGRWLQDDPNASGVILLTTVPFHGNAKFGGPQAPVVRVRIMDGLSMSGYSRSDPVGRHDQLGLFSSLEVMGSMGVQGLIGGIVNGSMTKALGGSFSSGFVAGGVGGMFGGALGGSVNAFAGSAAGLFAKLAVGGASGFGQGFGSTYISSNGNLQMAIADGLFGMAIGVATGGIASRLSSNASPLAKAMAGSSSGAVGPTSMVIAGETLEVFVGFVRNGDEIVLSPMILNGMYEGAADAAKVGVSELRRACGGMVKDAFDAGAKKVVVEFTRMGSTGGRVGRSVRWEFDAP